MRYSERSLYYRSDKRLYDGAALRIGRMIRSAEQRTSSLGMSPRTPDVFARRHSGVDREDVHGSQQSCKPVGNQWHLARVLRPGAQTQIHMRELQTTNLDPMVIKKSVLQTYLGYVDPNCAVVELLTEVRRIEREFAHESN